MKIKLIVFIILVPLEFCYAQSSNFKKAEIGYDVSDLEFKNVMNYQKETIKLNDYKGKLIILDFWNTRCRSCIESWPKLLALKKKFSNELEIILVNPTQDKRIIRQKIETREKNVGFKMDLPIVFRDSLISKIFPHQTVPHIVWINKEGICFSVTRSDVLNEKNIELILSGKMKTMPQKVDFEYEYSFEEPLFINGNGGFGENILWQSVLSGYYPGFFGTMYFDKSKGLISNTLKLDMFRFLYGKGTNRFGAILNVPRSQVELQVKDTLQYTRTSNGEVQYNNLYTYQLFSKDSVSNEKMKDFMISDLKRYFGLSVEWQQREKMCLVISSKDTSILKYEKGPTRLIFNDVRIEWNNVSISEIIQYMLATTQYSDSPYPIIDETGFTRNIGGVKFEGNNYNYISLSKNLAKYGLQFQLQKRIVPVLVIKEI